MTFAPIGPNHLTDASKVDGITFFQFFQLANLGNTFGFRVDQKLTPLGHEYTHGDRRLFHDRCFETSTSFRQMLPQNCFLAVERNETSAPPSSRLHGWTAGYPGLNRTTLSPTGK